MNEAAQKSVNAIRKSRFNPVIQQAQNEDGPLIGDLVKENGFDIDVDWNDVFPYWLVARWEDEIVGCIQVLPGKPVGCIEMLSTKELDGPKRAQIAWRLIVAAKNVLSLAGAQVAASVVSFDNKHFKRLLKKRGWKIGNQGNVMIVRVL